MSDFEKGAALVAVVLSIGVHLLGVLAFVFLVASGAMQRADARVDVPEEQVLIRPEMFLVEEPSSPAERFLKSSRQAATDQVSESLNISDVDSRAASEGQPENTPVEEQAIVLDGEVEHGMAVADQDFVDALEEGNGAAGDGSSPRPPVAEISEAQQLDELLPDAAEAWQEFWNIGEGRVISLPESPTEENDSGSSDSAQQEERPPTPDYTDQSSRQAADTGFTHETRRRKLRGTLSNQGAPSFDAKATPTGKYLAQVTREIERKWRAQVDQHRDFFSFATLRVTFKIDKSGTVHDLKISRAEANAVIKDFTLSAILEAELPPIPEDLWDILEGEQIQMSYDVVIY